MITIVDNELLEFNLWGLSAAVPNEQYGDVGMRLMNEMWNQLRTNSVRNSGERVSSPSLEVYGHQSPNANTPPETTIIIALESH